MTSLLYSFSRELFMEILETLDRGSFLLFEQDEVFTGIVLKYVPVRKGYTIWVASLDENIYKIAANKVHVNRNIEALSIVDIKYLGNTSFTVSANRMKSPISIEKRKKMKRKVCFYIRESKRSHAKGKIYKG